MENLTIISIYPDCVLAGGAEIDQREPDTACDDDSAADFLVPISTQSVSQHMLDAKNAEGDRLYLRHYLVGFWPQSHCLLHCLSCNSLSLLIFQIPTKH